MDSGLGFDVQCFWKLMEWLPHIRFFNSYIWAVWHCTVISKSLKSGYHGGFNKLPCTGVDNQIYQTVYMFFGVYNTSVIIQSPVT